MSSPVVLAPETAADLAAVTAFFGIDIDCSRHIFRHAAATDPAAFATIVKSLAEAVRQDARFGTAARIRRRIAEERARED